MIMNINVMYDSDLNESLENKCFYIWNHWYTTAMEKLFWLLLRALYARRISRLEWENRAN